MHPRYKVVKAPANSRIAPRTIGVAVTVHRAFDPDYDIVVLDFGRRGREAFFRHMLIAFEQPSSGRTPCRRTRTTTAKRRPTGRKGGPCPISTDELLSLYNKPMSINAIAALLRISPRTVARHLRRHPDFSPHSRGLVVRLGHRGRDA